MDFCSECHVPLTPATTAVKIRIEIIAHGRHIWNQIDVLCNSCDWKGYVTGNSNGLQPREADNQASKEE